MSGWDLSEWKLTLTTPTPGAIYLKLELVKKVA